MQETEIELESGDKLIVRCPANYDPDKMMALHKYYEEALKESDILLAKKNIRFQVLKIK